MEETVGVVDVGTYSCRLLVGKGERGKVKIVYREGKIINLGEGVKESKLLKEEKVREALKVLRYYREKAKSFNCKELFALFTEAVRVAKNREKLLNEVENLGYRVKLLTPKEEGELSYLGATYPLNLKGKVLVIDQGGGSTEFTYGEGKKVLKVISLPYGIVNLTESFFPSGEPKDEELKELLSFLEKEFKIIRDKVDEVVGIGGTITTITAMEYKVFPYNGDKVTGKTLTLKTLKRYLEKLSRLKVEERKKLKGMEDRRAKHIIPGIAVFLVALKVLNREEIRVSDWGLREGFLISRL